MENNICKFTHNHNSLSELSIINYVYEKESNDQKYILGASYSLNIVSRGEGVLHTDYGNFFIKQGDIFIKCPAKKYYIEKTDDLQYIYISFVGERACELLARINYQPSKPTYKDYSGLLDVWLKPFKTKLSAPLSSGLDLMAEGLLLYTLSYIAVSEYENIKNSLPANRIVLIKQYIDEHYTDSSLSLESLCKIFHYNYKYLSSKFKRTVGVSFSQYLNDLRLEHSKRLIEAGFTCIKEIAMMSGYSDPLYFSKLFKIKYGASPKLCFDSE